MCNKYPRAILMICIWGMGFIATVSVAQEFAIAATPSVAEGVVRDPTQPLGYTTASGMMANADYTLNSVLISSQRKHAVINGVTLREGQVIPGSGDIVIKRISPQTVVLQQGEKIWALRLSPSVVKRH